MSTHTDVLAAEAARMVAGAEAGLPLPADLMHKNSVWVSPITEADAWLWSAYWTGVTARSAKSPELARIARAHLKKGTGLTSWTSTFTADNSEGNIKAILRATWGQVSSLATPNRQIAKVWSLGDQNIAEGKRIERDVRPAATRVESALTAPADAARAALDAARKARNVWLGFAGVSLVGAYLLYRVLLPPPLRVNRARKR